MKAVNYQEIGRKVCEIDRLLRTEILVKDGKNQEKKLWENTFIKHQIDKRKRGELFSTGDHIRAMVYSMLSGGISWERVENSIDAKTGAITSVDRIFHQYDISFLRECDPDELANQIKGIGCASQSTYKQMTALIQNNIPKLIRFEDKYGSIDSYYDRYRTSDNSHKALVCILSNPNSDDKFAQLAEPLVAEYLKNVGYDLAKPDRHIRRILGKKDRAAFGCSEYDTAGLYETFDIIDNIAREINKDSAEVDFILWSICAKGYGNLWSNTSLQERIINM